MDRIELPEDVTVSFTHLRYPEKVTAFSPLCQPHLLRNKKLGFSPRGGQTVATIHRGVSPIAQGVADCSIRDNFCKKIGRDIAEGRAMKQLKEFYEINKTLPPMRAKT